MFFSSYFSVCDGSRAGRRLDEANHFDLEMKKKTVFLPPTTHQKNIHHFLNKNSVK